MSGAPSSASVYVYGAVPPVADIVTVVVPLTVAPAAGVANAAMSAAGVGAGGGVGAGSGVGAVAPFATLSETLETPLFPVASRALAVSIWTPSPESAVSYGSEIGPLVLLAEPTVRPPSVSVTVLDP